MAANKVSQFIGKMRLDNQDLKWLNDIFIALRESIAPVQGTLLGSTTVDVASIATGAQATVAVVVTGAALGDYVTGIATSADPGALSISGRVTGANAVTIMLANNSGGAIDPANMTYSVIVTPASTLAKRGNLQA